MPQKRRPNPSSKNTLFASLIRSPALWLALLAALALHAVLFFGHAWWHLPWTLHSAQRPSLMVQLLPTAAQPPTTAPSAPAPVTPTAPPESTHPQAPPQVEPAAAKPLPEKTAQPSPAAPLAASAAPSSTAPLTLPQDMQAPDSVTLSYRLSTGTAAALPGDSAQLRWAKLDESHYELTWEQSLGGKSTRLQSTGQLGGGGLQPERYSESGSDKSEVATHFVRDQGQIIFSNNSPSAALSVGAQDRVSVLMQLGGILAAQPEAQNLSAGIEIPVASSSGARLWQFRVLGLQAAPPAVLAQLGKDIPAEWLALEHDPSRDGGPPWEPTITIWYETQGFLPMRIQSRYANGQVQDAQFSGGLGNP